MANRYENFDDDAPSEGAKLWKEFECPECSAHNPCDDGFKVGDEVLCNYCGLTFMDKEYGGKYKLKEV